MASAVTVQRTKGQEAFNGNEGDKATDRRARRAYAIHMIPCHFTSVSNDELTCLQALMTIRASPLWGSWGYSNEDTPLLLRVYSVIDNLSVLQVARPVKDLLRIRGSLHIESSVRPPAMYEEDWHTHLHDHFIAGVWW